MKRLISILLCAALLAAVLCGCGTEETPYVPTGDALDYGDGSSNQTTPSTPEQDLTMVYYSDHTMNPYNATDFTNRALFSLLYQGLFSVDRDYNVTPILCSGYSVSSDMKTYTFQIADARFSDGTALTAGDVVASLEAAKAGSYYSGRFLHITSIQEAGGAVVILERDCTPEILYAEVQGLLVDEDRREKMAKALRGLVKIDSAERICDIVEELAKN